MVESMNAMPLLSNDKGKINSEHAYVNSFCNV